MPDPSLLQKCLKRIWDSYSVDVGKGLIHLGAVGWVLSAVAQVGSVIFNKKIDKKEKQFLIPQEIADGFINVTLFTTICEGFKTLMDNSIECGRFFRKDTHDFIAQFNQTGKGTLEFVKDLLKNPQYIKDVEFKCPKSLVSSFFDLFQNKHFKQVMRQVVDVSDDVVNAASETHAGWKNGWGTIVTIAASVLAGNIVTPYVRNKVASAIQKRHLKKYPVEQDNTKKPSGVYNPLILNQPRVYSPFKI